METSESKCCSHKLRLCALGFGIGVSWALGVLVLGLLSWKFHHYGHDFVRVLGSVYLGYGPTLKGAFIGALWGLLDGFIWGIIIAWLYNLCACCKMCCGKCGSCGSCGSSKSPK